MPQNLINRKTGERELIDDNDLQQKLASGDYLAPDAVAVHRDGSDIYTTADEARRDATFDPLVDPAQAELAHGHAIREKANTGLAATGKAILGGGASGLTMGAFNPFEDEQEFNRGASVFGQLGGALLPGLFGDEAGIAAAIARDPLAVEGTAANLSSKFLYAGELGGEAESTGRALERGLSRAGGAIGDAREAGVGLESAEAGRDLVGIDHAGLRTARDAEVGALQQAQAGKRVEAVGDLKLYRAAVDDANPWLVVDSGEEAAMLKKSSNRLRDALNDPKGLERNPSNLLSPLRVQEQALQRTLDDAENITAKFKATNEKLAGGLEEELATLPDDAEHVEMGGKLARRYGSYADVKVGKGAGATIKVARADAESFLGALKNGDVAGEGQAALDKLPKLIEANRALQGKIEDAIVAKSELTSPRLAAIDNAKDALSIAKSAREESLPEKMLKGSIFGKVTAAVGMTPLAPLAHVAGAKAADMIGRIVFGRMGEVATEGASKMKGAIDAFLDVAKRATPTLPVAATRVLAETRFAPSGPGASPAKGTEKLPALYAKRSAEIRSMTAYDETGTPRLRPEARAQVAAKFDPIRAVDPMLADRLETAAANRIEFLSAHLPRRPDFGSMPTGPDRWQPTDMAMRTWARYVAATEDPHGVERRLASGQVTPEDAEAYHALYPERAAALKSEIMARLPTLQKQLPYARRLALSIFTGAPVDPAMNPVVLAALQSHFKNELGSNGGTSNPAPQPQFGSVRKSVPEPTPADKRSQGG